MSSAVVAMGTTVAVGTAAVYGLSALFAEFLLWLERCLLVIVRFMRSMRCNRYRSIIILGWHNDYYSERGCFNAGGIR